MGGFKFKHGWFEFKKKEHKKNGSETAKVVG